MTEREKEMQRFISSGDGIKVEHPNEMPDWDAVLKMAEMEKKNGYKFSDNRS